MEAAVVIAQHMDPVSLASFAKRLGRIGTRPTKLASGRTPVEKGHLYILHDTALFQRRGKTLCLKTAAERGGYYHPTIDTLFLSAADLQGVSITAFLLSGIGADGARGLLKLKEAGHTTIVQDEATSVVYGMPKAAAELGAARQTASIGKIAERIREIV